MQTNLSFSSYFMLGVMLFALFFGAGNLIFPATLGQYAGSNVWFAIGGFLITGIGLPFLGIVAIGISDSRNLQELASRIHPIYAIIFTSLLYLTIGPFFAAPRTGAVAYDIGIAPFISAEFGQVGLFIFTMIFFGVTLLLSLNPAKIVDRIGKILAPGIVILLFVLLAMVIIYPLGTIEPPQDIYEEGAFIKGFTEGYNTMDALASLVFGIIIITAIREMGVTTKRGILTTTIKSGVVAVSLLGVIYVGVAYLGATSTKAFGLFETGGPVLSHASTYYFGTFGSIMLSVIIILACITTSIGLISACSVYFQTLIPKISYKIFVVFFSIFCFVIANFGLSNIIMYSVPVLMLLYPPAIVLIILTYLSPLFNHSRTVYVSATVVTLMISTVDGLRTFCDTFKIDYYWWLEPVVSFYERVLPLYADGLGWLLPALCVIVITGAHVRLQKTYID